MIDQTESQGPGIPQIAHPLGVLSTTVFSSDKGFNTLVSLALVFGDLAGAFRNVVRNTPEMIICTHVQFNGVFINWPVTTLGVWHGSVVLSLS